MPELKRELEYYKQQVDALSRDSIKNQYAIAELSNQLTQLRHGFAIISQIQKSLQPSSTIDDVYEQTLDLLISHLHLDSATVFKNHAGKLFVPWLENPSQGRQLQKTTIALPDELLEAKGTLFINSRTEKKEDYDPVCQFIGCPYLIASSYMHNGVLHTLVGGRKLERSLMSYAAFTEIDVFVLSSITSMVNAIEQQMTQHSALENERLRIARDMHDDLGSDLSKISIYCQLLQSNIAHEEIVSEYSEKIKTASSELIENLGNIIWTLNPVHNYWPNLIAYLREFSLEYLEFHDLRANFYAEDIENKPIGHEMRKNILMVAKEALRNIVKHAKARAVEINISYAEQTVHIHIADDGLGISGDRMFGNGLKNMAQRIASIGGDLTFSANKPTGTCIVMTLPII